VKTGEELHYIRHFNNIIQNKRSQKLPPGTIVDESKYSMLIEW
jgi:hypothetical protein